MLDLSVLIAGDFVPGGCWSDPLIIVEFPVLVIEVVAILSLNISSSRAAFDIKAHSTVFLVYKCEIITITEIIVVPHLIKTVLTIIHIDISPAILSINVKTEP